MIESNELVVCVNNADFGDFSAADLIIGTCYEVLAREDRPCPSLAGTGSV